MVGKEASNSPRVALSGVVEALCEASPRAFDVAERVHADCLIRVSV